VDKKTLYIILGAVGGVLLLCCGCGGIGGFFALRGIRSAADLQVRLNDLREVSMAAHSHYDAKKAMPASADDLRPFLSPGSKAADRIKSGEIEVVWNALPYPQQTQGTANVIYAWETKKGSDGRWLVVDMSGFAEIISDANFQAKPKAEKAK
jgi:hypothetical protein